jgi:hypothetical protein
VMMRAAAFSTTVVTAYYRIASKHGHDRYASWIANFLSLPMAVVIFGDADSLEFLERSHPASSMRQYRERPLASFETARWSWMTDEECDHERGIGHNRSLYQLWNEKIFMVRDVVNTGAYCTGAFAWVDIGCFRDRSWLPYIYGFPDARRFPLDRVTFLQIEPFQASETTNVGSLDNRFRYVNRIGGTMFAGGGSAFQQLAAVYADLLEEASSKGVFKGKDQSLYAFAVLRHPGLCRTIAPLTTGYDPWFFFHLAWSPRWRLLRGLIPIWRLGGILRAVLRSACARARHVLERTV